MKVVISQPMYFPWVGMFEQIQLCDIFVYYSDVQFSKGSFTNRVQIKASNTDGFKWLTVPLKNQKLGSLINQTYVDNDRPWKQQHRETLHASYRDAPFYNEVVQLTEQLFSEDHETIGSLSQRSMDLVLEYYDLATPRQFFDSTGLASVNASSERVFDIVEHFQGNTYITGHGARKYLNHDLFERNGIAVEYIDYRKNEYPQMWGAFNPHVSILDLIANTGKDGIQYINSGTLNWKTFLTNS